MDVMIVDLEPGDVVYMRHIPGFRTVGSVKDTGYVNGKGYAILGVYWREGRTTAWSEGNSYLPTDVVSVERRGDVPEGVAVCDVCGCDTDHSHRSDDYWAPMWGG